MSSNPNPLRGKFIVLEGPDFSGKTTQTDILVQEFTEMGIGFIRVREPGGTEMGEIVRNILKTDRSLCNMSEMLLFAAARAQIIQTVIEPALAAGKWVIADRFLPSTIAMQYYARGYIKYVEEGVYAGAIDSESVEDIAELTRMSLRCNGDRYSEPLIPDLTIFLMPSDALLDARAAARAGGLDRLEENSEYVKKVREGYRLLTCGTPDCNNITDGLTSYAGVKYTKKKAVILQDHEQEIETIRKMVKNSITSLFSVDRLVATTERTA